MITPVLAFDSCLLREDHCYFYDINERAIWKADKRFESASVVCFTGMTINDPGFHGMGIYGYEDSIFICNLRGRSIVWVDLSDYSCHEYGAVRVENFGFCNCCKGDLIYQIPLKYGERLTAFSMKEKRYQDIEASIMPITPSTFPFFDGENFYISEKDGNRVLKINLESQTNSFFSFPQNVRIGSVCSCNGTIYATSSVDASLWILSMDEVKHVVLDDIQSTELFSKMIVKGEYVIALPRFGKRLYMYNTQSGLVYKCHIPLENAEDRIEGRSLFYGCMDGGDVIYFFPYASPNLHILDMVSKTIDERKIAIKTSEQYIRTKEIWEEAELSLESFIEGIGN